MERFYKMNLQPETKYHIIMGNRGYGKLFFLSNYLIKKIMEVSNMEIQMSPVGLFIKIEKLNDPEHEELKKLLELHFDDDRFTYSIEKGKYHIKGNAKTLYHILYRLSCVVDVELV